MKTSNKILLAFIGCLFATPLLIAMDLHYKIKNKDFVVKTRNNTEFNRSGSFSHSRVIQIQSPEKGLLHCYLQPADQAAYSYTLSQYKDSVRIFNSNDTLYVKYVQNKDSLINVNNKTNEPDDLRSVNVYLDLLSFEKLDVNGADINIDSLPPAVDLLDISMVFGSLVAGNIEDGKSLHIKEMHVKAADSDLQFGPKFSAGTLKLNIYGLSELDLEKATIDEVSGSLSDSTKATASWKQLKNMALNPAQ
jgi:hypothetical protein